MLLRGLIASRVNQSGFVDLVSREVAEDYLVAVNKLDGVFDGKASFTHSGSLTNVVDERRDIGDEASSRIAASGMGSSKRWKWRLVRWR